MSERQDDTHTIPVCLRCKATYDMGCCLCPGGNPGELRYITWDEHTAWRDGVLPAVLQPPMQQVPGESSRDEIPNDFNPNHTEGSET